MEKIKTFLEALKTLEDIIKVFHEYKNLCVTNPTEKNEQFFSIVRDAMIQRFEYCTDFICKVFKIYLEEIEKIHIEVSSPRGIIRDAVTARLFTEEEAKKWMQMIESRNKTSHIYHEEIADYIAKQIPEYYVLMKTAIDRMQTAIEKNKN